MTVINHLLFSEIFFNQIRRETSDLDNLRSTLGTIRDTWEYYLPPPPAWDGPAWAPDAPFPADDVAQLRANVVEQIFAYLELTYGPCQTDERAFFLYGDWAREEPTGLCVVLPYSADIEGRDPDTGIIPKGRNYAQQLIRLLQQHQLDWGVLTNGRQWRLFHRTELSPTETFLHVDLEQIIAADDIEDYIVFHRFFSRPAFVREDGRQRLDLYKKESEEVARVIENHLSAHVEEIARQLCQGLVESCRAADEDITAPETRKAIYRNALFLVYRLLFILYAEARGLLPLDAPAYRDVCLRDLLAEVRENHRQGMSYDDDHAMWDRLQALCALIDQGQPEADVPAYNGGLFDPGRRPFLTGHRIRNDYLQAALIRLSTIPARGQGYDQDREPQPIDYRDLSVRHLGSLYEGLLEYNLFVVEDEPRVVRIGKKKTQYVPYSQASKVRASETVLPVGDVYFSESEGERKATGSYYTPEDVVDYIVCHTVGEKLAERKAEFYEAQAIERQLADLADTPADIPAYRQIRQALDNQFLHFVREKVLDLKILDPAMGSGHFLVNATHTVANFIVDLLSETPWENAEIDTDVATWKRQVAERCIFGVDLNELAVELAKLCLWMTTTARDKPLTFLDHHLRWGNSLVGAWFEDVGVYPLAMKKDKPAFTLPLGSFQVDLDRVLDSYQQIYAKSSDDVDEVREKARIFDEEIRPAHQPHRELLDLHTGVYFGNGLDETTYAQLGAAVVDPAAWMRLKISGLSDFLAKNANQRWFHWQIEFPEVFCYASNSERGFDVALGNPPYAAFPATLPHVFASMQYVSAAADDLYALFVERACRVSGASGAHGFIVPLSLTFSSRLKSLRKMLESQPRVWNIYSFDKRPQAIFPNVQQRTSIIIGRPSAGSAEFRSGPLLRWRPQDRKTLFSTLRAFGCTDLILDIGIPKLGSAVQAQALWKMLSAGGSVSKHFAQDLKKMKPAQRERLRVYFFGVAYRWLVAARALPPRVSPEGQTVHLGGFSSLYFTSEDLAWAYMAVLNSLTAFWFWLMYGDSFHVTKTLLGKIPVDTDCFALPTRRRLAELGAELQEEMPKHVFYGQMQGKVTANYNVLACRHITDEVDWLLMKETSLNTDFLEDMKAFCASAAGER